MLEGVPLRRGDYPVPLPNGLYRVATSYLCAGFVVEDGQVVECAPILWRKLRYWATVAERIVNYE